MLYLRGICPAMSECNEVIGMWIVDCMLSMLSKLTAPVTLHGFHAGRPLCGRSASKGALHYVLA